MELNYLKPLPNFHYKSNWNESITNPKKQKINWKSGVRSEDCSVRPLR